MALLATILLVFPSDIYFIILSLALLVNSDTTQTIFMGSIEYYDRVKKSFGICGNPPFSPFFENLKIPTSPLSKQ